MISLLVAPLVQNIVYRFPDVWVCLYDQYGCDTEALEPECVSSAWNTEGGAPDAIFYPSEETGKSDQNAAEQLQIEANVLSEDPFFWENNITPVRDSPEKLVHARGRVFHIVRDVVFVDARCLRPSRGAASRLVSPSKAQNQGMQVCSYEACAA